MKHYLTNNEIRAIEEGQEFLVQSDWVLLSDEELYARLNPPKTAEQILAEKVAEAKAYLASTDFKMTVDYYATLNEQEQAEITYNRAKARTFLKEQGL